MGYYWNDGGYSSEVEIYLLADGVRYEVAQVGPNTIILRNGESVRPGHAQLHILVDGRREIHDIIIGAGAAAELEYA